MSLRLRVALVGLVLASLAAAGAGGSAAAAQDCPSWNTPDTLVLQAGTPQWSKIGSPYASPFQVGLANSNGCPVTAGLVGVPVTFTAPSSGAGGTFATSGSNSAVVGTSAQGVAAAPQFTANHATGDFTVVASSQYGSVTFALHNTASGVPATIGAVGATRQSATTGGRYAAPLEATVKDADGNPVEGVGVTFSLGAGAGGAGGGGGSGATAAGATFDGGTTQATALTDATGTATSPLFTAGSTAGSFSASASTSGVVEPAIFSLRNVAGRPARITVLAPARQSALLGARYGTPLRVKLLDGRGKPLEGASVAFSLGSGSSGGAGAGAAAGASFVGGTSQAAALTDAAGVAASPAFTANAVAGTFTAEATASGTSAAATFALDNLPGRLRALGGGARSAIVGGSFGRALRVELRGAGGKRVEGATVTFTLGSAGGGASGSSGSVPGASFAGGGSQATAVTDAAGVATSPFLTANTAAGAFTATASVSGVAKAATFSLRNLPDGAKTLAAGVAASESTAIGTRFAVRLAVTVTDAHQNPVPNAVVVFSAPARGPSGRFVGKGRIVRVRTDADGVAVAPPFVADRSQGGYVVRAAVPGARTAAFALVNLPA